MREIGSRNALHLWGLCCSTFPCLLAKPLELELFNSGQIGSNKEATISECISCPCLWWQECQSDQSCSRGTWGGGHPKCINNQSPLLIMAMEEFWRGWVAQLRISLWCDIPVQPQQDLDALLRPTFHNLFLHHMLSHCPELMNRDRGRFSLRWCGSLWWTCCYGWLQTGIHGCYTEWQTVLSSSRLRVAGLCWITSADGDDARKGEAATMVVS